MSSKILGKNESQYVPSIFHLRRVSGAIATIKSKIVFDNTTQQSKAY
jgi:hypothetical protein